MVLWSAELWPFVSSWTLCDTLIYEARLWQFDTCEFAMQFVSHPTANTSIDQFEYLLQSVVLHALRFSYGCQSQSRWTSCSCVCRDSFGLPSLWKYYLISNTSICWQLTLIKIPEGTRLCTGSEGSIRLSHFFLPWYFQEVNGSFDNKSKIDLLKLLFTTCTFQCTSILMQLTQWKFCTDSSLSWNISNTLWSQEQKDFGYVHLSEEKEVCS